MSIFDDAQEWAQGKIDNLSGWIKENETLVNNAGAALGAYALKESGLTEAEIQRAGYQGTVPDLTAVRARVPFTSDPNRRPGSYGRRYFSDIRFIADADKASGIEALPQELYGATRKTKAEQDIIKQQNPDAQFDSRGYRINEAGNIVTDADPSVELRRYLSQGIDESRGAFTPEQQEAFRKGPQVIGTTAVPATIEDPDDPTATIANPDRDPNKTYTPEGFEILDQAAYDRISGATDFDASTAFTDGFATDSDQVDAQFDSAGYLITQPEERTFGKNYTDEGYEIKTLGRDFTNRAVAEDLAAAEAIKLAGIQAFNPYAGQQGLGAENVDPTPFPQGTVPYAQGGITQLSGGRYLDGMTDGMADKVPANIEGTQPAALSDGEFVIPADVVSGLGNGSSNAGAKVLNNMMTKVRKERTGNPEQGKKINPQRVMAKSGIAQFANGGPIKKFQAGDTVTLEPANVDLMNQNTASTADTAVSSGQSTAGDTTGGTFGDDGLGTKTGVESALTNYAGKYVTDMLGEADAVFDLGYQAYEGPLSAGESDLQRQAFETAGGLDTSGAQLGSFGDLTSEQREAYMNPYLEGVMDPEIRRAQERAQIDRMKNAARMAQAGSFGGSRQAIMEGMMARDTAQQLADIENRARSQAFQQASDRFDADRRFGLDALQRQTDLGAIQRDIEAEGIAADYDQFKEERLFPYKNLQFKSSILQGLPLESQDYTFSQPSTLSQLGANYEALGGGLSFDSTTDFLSALGLGGSGVSEAGSTVNIGGIDYKINPDGSVTETQPTTSESGFMDLTAATAGGLTYTMADKPPLVSEADWKAALQSGDEDTILGLLDS